MKKWPRVRFTVRRLMIAVAILALTIRAVVWVGEMRKLSAEYERRAFEFGLSTARLRSGVQRSDGSMASRYDDENNYREDAWACKLAEKYWRLSDYPWLPVEPDPPPPRPLPHPRRGVDLPAEMECHCYGRKDDPPAWTFLWSRRQPRW